MNSSWTKVKIADGTEMRLYVAEPDQHSQQDLFAGDQKRPGILVLQEAFGLNHHIRSLTERFATLGFYACAPELFHRTGEGFEGSYTDFPTVKPHVDALTDAGMSADLRSTYEWLHKNPKVDGNRLCAIGYCMGGRAAFLANAELPLQCAVSYYGSRIAPSLLDKAKSLHGSMMLIWGGQDTHIGYDQKQSIINALREAKKSYTNLEFGDANHGFFCDERAAFHKESADQSWALVQQFFRDHLQPSTMRTTVRNMTI